MTLSNKQIEELDSVLNMDIPKLMEVRTRDRHKSQNYGLLLLKLPVFCLDRNCPASGIPPKRCVSRWGRRILAQMSKFRCRRGGTSSARRPTMANRIRLDTTSLTQITSGTLHCIVCILADFGL